MTVLHFRTKITSKQLEIVIRYYSHSLTKSTLNKLGMEMGRLPSPNKKHLANPNEKKNQPPNLIGLYIKYVHL